MTMGNAGAIRVANWLSLAAAPTFAIMALVTGVAGNQAMLCAAGQGSPLSGMAAMYALMSAFHLAPWLKLVAARAGGHLQADATSQTPGMPSHGLSDRARNNPASRWSTSRPRADHRRRP